MTHTELQALYTFIDLNEEHGIAGRAGGMLEFAHNGRVFLVEVTLHDLTGVEDV